MFESTKTKHVQVDVAQYLLHSVLMTQKTDQVAHKRRETQLALCVYKGGRPY